MKAIRILLKILIALVVIIALLVGVALIPAVQTWAVRKAVASQPGMKLDVARVSAGISSANLSQVRFVKDGVVVTADRIAASYSAWDYLSRRRLTVRDLAVENLLIDARAGGTTEAATATDRPSTGTRNADATPQPAQPFHGLLGAAELPFDVAIARFSIPGRAVLPNNQTAEFEVHGSDITTGQRGTIDWKADIANATPDAPLRALHASGTANVHITTERRIDLLELNLVAAAEGAKLPSDQLKIEAKAEQPAAGGNEGYSASVSLLRQAAAEPLATLVGQYNANSREISGVWKLSVRSEQLTALLSGLGLPDIAAEGTGKFAANPDASTVTATGELRSTISHPEKTSPGLAQIGTVQLQAAFNAGLADGVARLDELSVDATASTGRKLAQIRTLQRVGFSLRDKRVSFADANADLGRISIDALPLAWAKPFVKTVAIEGGEASMILAVTAAPDGSHVRVSAPAPLTLKDVTVSSGGRKLAEHMSLAVKPVADYSSDAVHAELNELAMTTPTGDAVAGRFTVDIKNLSTTPLVAFTTDTQAKFVAALKPYVPVDTGPIAIATKSAGSLEQQTLRFSTSTTRVTRATGQLIAAVELAQPLAFDLKTNAVTSTKPDAEALVIQLGEVPLSWAQGVVANAQFSGQVAGGTLAVSLRSLNDLSASTKQPISVRSVGVILAGQPKLQGIDATLDLNVGKQGDHVRYDLRRFEARQGSAMLAAVSVAGEAVLGDKPTVTAKGRLDADAAVLVQQPALIGSGLARGAVHADFEADIRDAIQAKATITARDLVARQDSRPLGNAKLDLTAALQADGTSVVTVPFTLTNGARKSDLTLDGKLARSGNGVRFDGRITSSQLFLDDLTPLTSLAPDAGTKPAPSTPTSPTPAPAPGAPARTNGQSTSSGSPASTPPAEAKAFWAGVEGKLNVDMKELTYGADYVIHDIRGGAVISPDQLALNSLEGRLKENPFKLSAQVRFSAADAQPYSLAAMANVDGFDVGEFLRAGNPKEKPQIESLVAVNAKLNGKGKSAADLAKNVYGTFDVNGGKGVLRMLANTKAGTAADLVSKGLSLFGAVKGSEGAVATGDLVGKFAELPFEKFTMHVDRGADLDLKIGQIEFVSPEMRLTGGGGITNQPGVPVQNQPMQITLQLAAKGNMAVLLDRTHLLSGQQDEQGYYSMTRTFTLKGSAAKPDSGDLWSILLGQIGQQIDAGAALQKLLGK